MFVMKKFIPFICFLLLLASLTNALVIPGIISAETETDDHAFQQEEDEVYENNNVLEKFNNHLSNLLSKRPTFGFNKRDTNNATFNPFSGFSQSSTSPDTDSESSSITTPGNPFSAFETDQTSTDSSKLSSTNGFSNPLTKWFGSPQDSSTQASARLTSSTSDQIAFPTTSENIEPTTTSSLTSTQDSETQQPTFGVPNRETDTSLDTPTTTLSSIERTDPFSAFRAVPTTTTTSSTPETTDIKPQETTISTPETSYATPEEATTSTPEPTTETTPEITTEATTSTPQTTVDTTPQEATTSTAETTPQTTVDTTPQEATTNTAETTPQTTVDTTPQEAATSTAETTPQTTVDTTSQEAATTAIITPVESTTDTTESSTSLENATTPTATTVGTTDTPATIGATTDAPSVEAVSLPTTQVDIEPSTFATTGEASLTALTSSAYLYSDNDEENQPTATEPAYVDPTTFNSEIPITTSTDADEFDFTSSYSDLTYTYSDPDIMSSEQYVASATPSTLPNSTPTSSTSASTVLPASIQYIPTQSTTLSPASIEYIAPESTTVPPVESTSPLGELAFTPTTSSAIIEPETTSSSLLDYLYSDEDVPTTSQNYIDTTSSQLTYLPELTSTSEEATYTPTYIPESLTATPVPVVSDVPISATELETSLAVTLSPEYTVGTTSSSLQFVYPTSVISNEALPQTSAVLESAPTTDVSIPAAEPVSSTLEPVSVTVPTSEVLLDVSSQEPILYPASTTPGVVESAPELTSSYLESAPFNAISTLVPTSTELIPSLESVVSTPATSGVVPQQSTYAEVSGTSIATTSISSNIFSDSGDPIPSSSASSSIDAITESRTPGSALDSSTPSSTLAVITSTPVSALLTTSKLDTAPVTVSDASEQSVLTNTELTVETIEPTSVYPVLGSAPVPSTTISATPEPYQVAPSSYPTPYSTPIASQTTNWLPKNILTQSGILSSGASTASATTTLQTSALPKLISPMQTYVPSTEYELITIGFKEGLNYNFIVENSLATAQIFEYLPGAVTFPLNGSEFDQKSIFIKQLVPYTATGLDYIITVAEIYYPINQVSFLQQQILLTNSKFYVNDDATEKTLASLVDSRVPLTDLINSFDLSSSSSNGKTNSDGLNPMDGPDEEDSSSTVTTEELGSLGAETAYSANTGTKVSHKRAGKIAGICIGVVVGASVYLALTLVFYRIWKNKRQIQLDDVETPRNSTLYSLSNGTPQMSQLSSVNTNLGQYPSDGFIGKYSGNQSRSSKSGSPYGSSRRTSEIDAYIPKISQPVEQHNSLGWE